MAEQDQEFVESVVRAIVGHPDDVRTERTIDERGVLITLFINQEDMGYVIGRQGQTARSLRTLLKIVGAKNNARVNLKIFEPEGSRRPPRRTDDAAPVHVGASQSNSYNSAPRSISSNAHIDTSAVDLTI